jgi:hypothetical protein
MKKYFFFPGRQFSELKKATEVLIDLICSFNAQYEEQFEKFAV